MVVGNVALHAGMQWARPIVTIAPSVEHRPRMHALLGLWLLSMVFRLAPNVVSSLGAIAGVMHFGSTSALAAFVLSRDPRKRNGFFWLLLLGGTTIEFATNLNSGSKAYLMFSFMPALWLFLRDQKLRRYVPLLSGVMFVWYVSVIAPVVMTSRTARADTHESHMSRIIRTYSRGDYEDEAGTDKQLPRFLERAFDATATACIYSEVERVGFMYGEGMDYLVYAFIPRAIWPDKPSVTRGAWFSEYLGQARSEETATTSLGQTAPGELYWNFGWPGVLLGMSLLGVVCGKLWKLATPFAERDSLRLLLYFGITFQVINMAEAGSAFLSLVYRTVIIGFAIVTTDRMQRSRGRT
ncbi:MAG: oligosaccharide repeat unit polymerase [Polyangiaceae bacterium]|nr:oligosaccharide repeat unit polymerase [Polyangiaceae bacterium]